MQPKVRIIGGGFSGLVTARAFVRRGFDVTVEEQQSHFGGMIQSPQSPHGIYETAANGILNSLAVRELFQDCQVAQHIPPASAKKRFIFRDDRLQQWPLGIFETLAFVLSWLKSRLFNQHWPKPNETLKLWCERVLTAPVYQYLLAPAMQGIYAGDASRLSATLLLKRLFLPGQPKVQPRGTVFPAEGMQKLIEGLKEYLKRKNVSLKESTSATLLQDDSLVVIATNAPAAAKLLNQVAPKAAQILSQIEMLPLVTVQVFASPKDHVMNGFGALFPRGCGVRSLGVLWDHALFPQRQTGPSERWILGGATDREVIQMTDMQIEDLVRLDRKKLQGQLPWRAAVITRWPQALPHYTVELETQLNQLELPANVALVGNYTGAIGLAQIVLKAESLAESWKAQYGR